MFFYINKIDLFRNFVPSRLDRMIENIQKMISDIEQTYHERDNNPRLAPNDGINNAQQTADDESDKPQHAANNEFNTQQQPSSSFYSSPNPPQLLTSGYPLYIPQQIPTGHPFPFHHRQQPQTGYNPPDTLQPLSSNYRSTTNEQSLTTQSTL
jgi:hypothetical protein